LRSDVSKSGDFPREIKQLSPYLRLRALALNSADFLKDYGGFRSHLRLHDFPADSGRSGIARRRTRLGLRVHRVDFALKPTGGVIERIGLSPALVGLRPSRPLTALVATRALTVAYASIRLVPAPADAARSFFTHSTWSAPSARFKNFARTVAPYLAAQRPAGRRPFATVPLPGQS
jgi:hypothetical protein